MVILLINHLRAVCLLAANQVTNFGLNGLTLSNYAVLWVNNILIC